MVQHRVRQLFLAAHAAERLDVLLGLLLDHVHDVVEGDDADQAVVVVHDRRRDEVVALEQPRHLLLLIGGVDRTQVLFEQILDRNRPLGAQQTIERDHAGQPAVGVDHVDLPEAIRKIGRLAHVVDGLADRPIRPDGDELVLHPPAGGIFRIVQAAPERDALDRRQLFEDLGLILLRQVLQNGDGVVGIELTHALGDGFGRKLFEDLFADGVVDLGQRREVEIGAHQRDQARAQVRIERLENGAGIGLMQFADQLAQQRRVAGLQRPDDLLDIVRAQVSVRVARRNGGQRHGHVFVVEHAGPSD